MKADFFKGVDQWRIRKGAMGSEPGRPYGAFLIPFRTAKLAVIADWGRGGCVGGWEHVSVSLPNRCPNWDEMCFIKDLFWDDEETVVQFHPRKSEYVNNYPHCLHLWRQVGVEPVLPTRILV